MWLCPKCGEVNEVPGDQGPGEKWLGCVPFEGEESHLPTGFFSKSPGLMVLDFVAAYVVLDQGKIIQIDPWTLPNGIPGQILAVIINEAAVELYQSTYNGRGIMVADVDGNMYTIPEWRKEHHTDPLALLAISRAYLATTGPGVQVYRPAGTKFGLDATKIAGVGQSRTKSGRIPVKLGKW